MENLKWTIGDAQIAQITEIAADDVLQQLMSDAAPEKLKQMSGLEPHFIDRNGKMKGWFQSFLVTVGGKNFLIEGGIGNGRQRPHFPGMHNLQTDFLKRLHAHDVTEAQIDYVISSHLHIDHVGWFTQPANGQFTPTFPNARYIIVMAEYDFWKDRKANPDQMAAFQECVEPVVRAGLVDFVNWDFQLNEHIRLLPSPGHTSFHVTIHLESNGQRAVFCGDVLPHPSTIMDPKLEFGSDSDPEKAVETRYDLLEQLADTYTIMFAPHFADPVAVKIKTRGNGFGFDLA